MSSGQEKGSSNTSSTPNGFTQKCEERLANEVQFYLAMVTSDEEQTTLKYLKLICDYSVEDANRKACLISKGGLEKIEYNIFSTSNCVLRLTLKLLYDLLKESTLEEHIIKRFNREAVLHIGKLYVESEDIIIQDISLLILLVFIKNSEIKLRLLEDINMLDKTFQVLCLTRDPDIQKNSLLLMDSLFEAHEILTFLRNSALYSPRMIWRYTENPYEEICEIAVKLLLKITLFKDETLQTKIAEEELLPDIYKAAENPEKAHHHESFWSMIINSMACLSTATAFMDSEQFPFYLMFIKECDNEHLHTAAKILYAITQYQELHQTLHDLAAEKAMLSLLRMSDREIHYYVCLMVKNLSRHRYIAEELLKPVMVKCFIDLINTTEISTSYFSMVINIVKQLIYQPWCKIMDPFFRMGGIEMLLDIISSSKEQLTEEDCLNILKIIYMYCGRYPKFDERYKGDFEFCQMVVNHFKDSNGDMELVTFSIINTYCQDDVFMKHFYRLNGPNVVVRKLKSTLNEQVLLNFLQFVYNTVHFKDVCNAYVAEHLHSYLQKQKGLRKTTECLVEHTLQRLYKLFLPLKFHEKGYLDIDDKLDTGFYVIDGKWDQDFPFLDTLITENVTTDYTVYFIDYSTPPDYVYKMQHIENRAVHPDDVPRGSIVGHLWSSLRSASRQKTIQKRDSPRKHLSFSSERRTSSRASAVLKSPSSRRNSILSDSFRPENIHLKKQPLKERCGKYLLRDPYLMEYVSDITNDLYRERGISFCLTHKVRWLALYIERKTSGLLYNIEQDYEQQLKHFDVHISILKRNLATNILPIGYVRYKDINVRALLFKALADVTYVPTTLARNRHGKFYNEIFFNISADSSGAKPYYVVKGVVDLIDTIGKIYMIGTAAADKYLETKLGAATNNLTGPCNAIKTNSSKV